jgi:hypothetical protein
MQGFVHLAEAGVHRGESRRIDVTLRFKGVHFCELLARANNVSAGRVGGAEPRSRRRPGAAGNSALRNLGLYEGFLAFFLNG